MTFLNTLSDDYTIGSKIDNETFQSYRCLLKREISNGHIRYYDLSYQPNEDGTLSTIKPHLMSIRNVFSNFTGITTFGNYRHTCYIIIINRNSKKVVEFSGLLSPHNRQLYMSQFTNMFKKFDSMVIESNIEDVIKRRFLS